MYYRKVNICGYIKRQVIDPGAWTDENYFELSPSISSTFTSCNVMIASQPPVTSTPLTALSCHSPDQTRLSTNLLQIELIRQKHFSL